MLNAWNGIGLCTVHSNVLAVCASLLNSFVEVKYEGTNQGLLLTALPLAKIS